MHYFDHQTATFTSDGVVTAMRPYWQERFGSPIAPHNMGQALLPDLDRARAHLGDLIGAGDGDAVLLMPSGADAVNQVVFGTFIGESQTLGKNHYLVGQNDEAAAILSIERLEEWDCSHDLLPVDQRGIVTAEAVREALTPRTALVSLSLVNGVTGCIQPIAEIAALCREAGVLIHVEATHALASESVEFARWGLDFATLSADQLHGPKGAGALVARRGLRLAPLIATGLDTICHSAQNPAALVGLGQAALEVLGRREEIQTRVALTRHAFAQELQSCCPEAQLLLEHCDRVPQIAVLAFPGVFNEAMAYRLNCAGISATYGGGRTQQIHYLLEAMGIEPQLAQSALSFSFSPKTEVESARTAARSIGEIYEKVSRLSGGLR